MFEILMTAVTRWCYSRPDYPIDYVLEGLREYYDYRYDLYQQIRETWSWVRTLPRCPLTESEARASNTWCYEGSNILHPGTVCYRSINKAKGPGQQCCYSGGKLITIGPSAGTPDRVGYAIGKKPDGSCEEDPTRKSEHGSADRVPAFAADRWLGFAGIPYEEYVLLRPPSGSEEEQIVQRVAEDDQ